MGFEEKSLKMAADWEINKSINVKSWNFNYW